MMAVDIQSVEEFIGNRLVGVMRSNQDDCDDYILWTFENGKVYKMYHEQDCCEDVYIESIDGELDLLVGNNITMAEEVCQSDDPPVSTDYIPDSYTWTFYKFADDKGHYVTIRWFGESNGYYSETAMITELKQ